MAVAKPGAIKFRCDPNALSTFLEYLIDYALPETGLAGEKLIEAQLDRMAEHHRARASRMLERVRAGERDVYV
jgi:2-iminoacetate synthase